MFFDLLYSWYLEGCASCRYSVLGCGDCIMSAFESVPVSYPVGQHKAAGSLRVIKPQSAMYLNPKSFSLGSGYKPCQRGVPGRLRDVEILGSLAQTKDVKFASHISGTSSACALSRLLPLKAAVFRMGPCNHELPCALGRRSLKAFGVASASLSGQSLSACNETPGPTSGRSQSVKAGCGGQAEQVQQAEQHFA